MTAQKGFIKLHLEYAGNLTDAPEIYHKILALNNLSLAVGRTPIKVSPYVLFPNLDIILIGLSGVAHKSTAMKLAMNILPNNLKNKLPNAFSPEALQEALSEHPKGLIYIDEIAGLLESIKKRDYMSGMADLLSQLFDCPDVYNKRLRGKIFKLKNVCFNTVSATTPSRFLDTVEPSDFNSGFMSRKLVVMGIRTKTLERRKIGKVDEKRLKVCKELWKKIYVTFDQKHQQKRPLSFEFEDSALKYINSWCNAKDAEVLDLDDAHEADLKGAISARMQDYAFKLAALFEVDKLSTNVVSSVSRLVVSKGLTQSITISAESAEMACSFIDYLLTQLTTNILTRLTHSKLNIKLTRLSFIIKNKSDSDGWIQHRKLLQLMNCSADQLRKLLYTAAQRDLIESITLGKATYYRAKPAPKGNSTDSSPSKLQDAISCLYDLETPQLIVKARATGR